MKEANRKLYIEDKYIDRIQLICLLILAVLELFIITLGDQFLLNAGQILRLGLMGSCGLFLMCELFRMYQNRCIRFPILPCLTVVWFVIIRIIHGLMQMDTYYTALFIPVYLLAFPFASVTRDSEKQRGLKLSAMIFVAAGLILTLYSLLLLANRVPTFLQGEVFWDGTRLNAILHTNLTACVLMIAITFCAGFSGLTPRKWLKALLTIAALIMFMAMALTNCRTAIAVTCLAVAGIVFFSIYKDNWKQFVAGIAAALVVTGLLVWGANTIYEWNSQRLSGDSQLQHEQSADAYTEYSLNSENDKSVRTKSLVFIREDQSSSLSPLSVSSAENSTAAHIRPAKSPQGSFFHDLLTLNNRIRIWGNMIKGFKSEPEALLWGARSVEELIDIPGTIHTHNSLTQMLVKLGLPGFIMSLLFTAQALWSIAYLMLSRKADLWKKIVAMLVLCLLISGMMEPFLFISSEHYHFADFMFFLCLGYLIQWRKALQKEKKQTN